MILLRKSSICYDTNYALVAGWLAGWVAAGLFAAGCLSQDKRLQAGKALNAAKQAIDNKRFFIISLPEY